MNNIILKTDSYKLTHAKQYPPDTQYIYSYLESRGGLFGETVFFGLQYILQKHFVGQVVTLDKIIEAGKFCKKHFGNNEIFNHKGWHYILNYHKGRLPLRIKAVAEGSVVPTRNVLITVENTDPNCYWLVNAVETLLVQAWYPITVATLSREIKKVIKEFLLKTADDAAMGGIDFKLHDFGYRGVSSCESAAIGGAAHLLNFLGSDTIAGIEMLQEYYGSKDEMYGFSIPAGEHSTYTSWGKENEAKAYENMLNVFESGIIACVSDSYDIYNACRNIWGEQLLSKVEGRDGVVVIRPDCYDEITEVLTEDGWKLIKDINDNDYVAQVDSNKNIEFVKPLKKINQRYAGKMVHFTDKKGRLDLLVTPNHRMVISKNNKILIESAQDSSFYHTKNMLRAGIKKSGINKLNELERLYIAFQADGSYSTNQKPNDKKSYSKVTIRFNFSKKRKIDRLINICKRGNFEYEICQEPSRKNQKTIYIKLDHFPLKDFSWVNLDSISGNWGKEFIEELSYWDSTRRTNTRFKYDTTNKSCAEKVQQICAISGIGCLINEFKDNRKECFNNIYSLSILTNKDEIGGQSIQKTEIDFNGRIYCLTVPSGMLLVRRNDKVVVSGNSGNPIEVVPQLLDILGEKFGFRTNQKGYKVLNPKIRLIWGDGINLDSVKDILHVMEINHWSAENIAFGMGGALLQQVNRDTQKFAFKASSIVIKNGESLITRDIFKDPITDQGKVSKKGRLSLINNNGYHTVPQNECEENLDLLQTVFENGELKIKHTIEEIRERVKL